jgi:hypothetical protein
MTPRQLAAAQAYYQRRRKRHMAQQMMLMQVATSRDKKAIKERLKELLRNSD